MCYVICVLVLSILSINWFFRLFQQNIHLANVNKYVANIQCGVCMVYDMLTLLCVCDDDIIILCEHKIIFKIRKA